MLLALRINVLAKGYSGISLETLKQLIAAFNGGFETRVDSRVFIKLTLSSNCSRIIFNFIYLITYLKSK